MKLHSKLFDSIRVKPDQDRLLRDANPACEWPGCSGAGAHRAPKGRGHDGEYLLFCIDHVRQYNKSYNYFKGMDDEAVIGYQKSALTGHRPTWKLGVNPAATEARETPEKSPRTDETPFNDTFGLFEEMGFESPRPQRIVRNAERRALDELGLDAGASAEDIKGRYKLLVKRHHPDANGGRRESEDKFREVIQAYNYLRSVGFC